MIDSAVNDGPIRVLLVEDDEDDYVLTRSLLETVFPGRMTLNWLKSANDVVETILRETFDVALIDYRLGSQTGIELIRSAREQGSRLPIILLTGQDEREIDLAATAAGATDFLSKTYVTSASLERAIRYSTQQAKLEEQRVRLLAERSARAEAEAGSRAKDGFLATLSHELRTPLTPVVIAVTAMCNDTSLPAALRQDLEMIRRNVELEAKLIDDLLDITHATRGTLQLRTDTVDVHSKVTESLRLCDEAIRAKRLRITTELAAAHFVVNGDPTRIQHMLWNLLQNAVKFTPAAGSIQIRSFDEDQTLAVEIRDNGIGIGPAMMPRLFEAFEQGIRQQSDQVNGGLGLGLAISNAVANLHGGSLHASSDGVGRGATFVLRLPAVNLAQSSSTTGLPPVVESRATPSRRKVLFVEDHQDTAMALVRVLKRQGFDVREARTVADAIAHIDAEPFDLLISDIGLPDGSGLDVMRHVSRSSSPFPAIALSGYGMNEDVESSLNAGFAKHVTKPIHPDVLIETVNELLRARVSTSRV